MNFWDNKLNGTPVDKPVVPRNMFSPQYVQQAPVQEAYTSTVRMTQGDVCPNCGSTSYRAMVPGAGNAVSSCFECGYNPRFEQSGFNTPSLRTEKGVARPARQTNDRSTMAMGLAAIANGTGLHA